MRNQFLTGAALALLAAATGIACASEESSMWGTDFEAAKAQAAAEHKDVLMDFTGSDWCVWCQKLDKEVFDQDGVAAKLKEHYVLLQLDYPRDENKLPGTLQSQNDTLRKTYPISGFPTILLCDAEGMPYASTGYEQGGPDKFLETLKTLQAHKEARDSAFAKAAKLEGVEKAKALSSALDALEMDDELVDSVYLGVTSEIKKADPKDETGFKAKEDDRQRLADFQQRLAQSNGNFDKAIKMISDTLAQPETKGEFRQMVHGYEAATYAYAKKFPEAIDILEKAVKEDPEGKRTEELTNFIDILKKQQEKEASGDKEESSEKKDGE